METKKELRVVKPHKYEVSTNTYFKGCEDTIESLLNDGWSIVATHKYDGKTLYNEALTYYILTREVKLD